MAYKGGKFTAVEISWSTLKKYNKKEDKSSNWNKHQ